MRSKSPFARRISPSSRKGQARHRLRGHGTIRDHTFLGNINEYFVTLGAGEELRVQTHPSQQFAIGQRVAVSVAAEHCNLFPRADLKSMAA